MYKGGWVVGPLLTLELYEIKGKCYEGSSKPAVPKLKSRLWVFTYLPYFSFFFLTESKFQNFVFTMEFTHFTV